MPINLQSSPAFDAQAIADSTDWQASAQTASQTGILSGCVISALGSPGMAIQTTAGSVAVAGTVIATPAFTSVTVQPASQSDRRDIVVADVGVVSVVMGTPCGTPNWSRNSFPGLPPVKPAIPANCVFLGEIYVPFGATSITAANIVVNATTLIFSPSTGGGGGSASVTAAAIESTFTAAGQLYVGTGATAGTQLAAGSVGTILTSNGANTVPAWILPNQNIDGGVAETIYTIVQNINGGHA